MPRISSLLLLVLLTACASDPLAVNTVTVDDPAPPDDGLQPLELTELPADWTETEGVLTATGPAAIPLLPEHGALTVALAFRVAEDTQAELRFQDGYALTLPGLELPGDSSSAAGPPVTPGFWQDLEVAFQPAGPDNPPLVAAVYLNGNLIHYQATLPPVPGPAGPLRLVVNAGTLSVTGLRTRARAGTASSLNADGSVALSLPLIHYAYYHVEDGVEDLRDWGVRTPVRRGFTSRFDIQTLRDRGNNWAARFTAELDVPLAGAYTFNLFSPASTRLYVDDQLVVDLGGRGADRYAEGQIELSEGTHRLRLDHYQYNGWNRLDVGYVDPTGRAGFLSDMRGDRPLATPVGHQRLPVATDERPYLLRSFLNFPPARVYEPASKRTHVVSVGEATGPHYSYDLSNGSLLMSWHGDFVDVNDMWAGRGEPQIARPLGNTIVFDGRPQWSTGGSGPWPDSLAELRHRRYELDAAGRPTFHFTLGERELSDRIVPTAGGLARTLTRGAGAGAVYTQLAAADRITETGPGSFELRGPGLRLDVTDYPAGGLTVRRGAGGDRLVAELPANGTITYEINW